MKPPLRLIILLIAWTALLRTGSAQAQGTAALEFAAGAGNPTGNGPTVANQVITFQNNTDNPNGNIFAATTPPVTATYVLSNQTYNAAPNISTATGTSFGATINNNAATAIAQPLFPVMNNPFTNYPNNTYTSAGAITAGTGIDVTVNSSVGLFNSVEAIPLNSPSTLTDRYLYSRLTITFSRAVINPVVHITDMGGNTGTLGFTTDLDLVPAAGVSLSKLSGPAPFEVMAGQIRNNSTTLPAANFTGGTAQIATPTGGITSIAFDLYVHGDGAGAWPAAATAKHSGDLFFVGISSVTPIADVATSISASASPVLAGQPLSFNVTYTNAGPTTAETYTQTLTLSAGLGAGNVTFANLPAGVTASYNNGSGVVTFTGTPTSLASGANQNLTVNIAAVPFNLTNVTARTAVGTTSYQGADTGANSASINVPVTPVADVATTITASPNPVVVGQPLSFAVTFTNAGPSAAAGYTQTLQLSAGLGAGNVTFANLQPGVAATYDNNTGRVSFTGVPTSLANGANQNLTVNIAAVPNTLASVSASTTVGTTANQGADTGANSASSNVPVGRVTDISTTLSGPTSATQGNGVTLNVTTSNLGTVAAFNVAQTVQLVAGLTNVFVSNNGTYNSVNGLVTFPVLPTLSAGQTIGNYVSFAAPAMAFAPTAAVTPNTAATGDSNPANNTATLNGAATPANIAIIQPTAATKVANLYTTISSSVLSAAPGSTVTLTVVTGNNGPSAAPNVVETTQLLPNLNTATLKIGGVVFTTQSGNDYTFANGAKYNSVTGLVTFATLNTLASGALASNTIEFTVPATANGQILPTAAVSSTSTDPALNTTDPVVADNFAATAITVLPTTDLVATISGPPAPVVLGQPVTYTATFINNGPATAINAVATVQLPVGLMRVVTSQGSYDATTGLVTFPVQPTVLAGAGQSYTISFVPTIDGNYPASATFSSNIVDVVPANNTARTSTSVVPATDLVVLLNAPASVAVGGPVTYVAETTNNGPSAATGVVTTIQLPIGLSAASVTSSTGGSYDATTGIVTFPAVSLANGATVSNFATYTNASATTFTGQAGVSSATSDNNPANNTSTTSTTVSTTAGVIDLLTTLTSPTATPVALGGAISLSVAYNNATSGTTASGVVEALYLPPGTVVNTVNGNPLAGNIAVSSYNPATGVLIFISTTIKTNKPDNYTVGLTAPSAGTSFSAVSAVSSNYAEAAGAATTNNRVQLTLPLAQPAAPVGYDEATTLTGPATALPGSAVTYTVQSLNNGPANSGTVTQTVTLPAGTVVTNNGGGTVVSNGTGVTITYTFTNQAPGVGAEVANSFTATMPTTGSLPVSVATTATGETGPTANNSASMTTTAANQAPVAAKLANVLQTPTSNTAGQVGITPLSATDADGSIASFRLNSIPDATNQGILYYNNAGTYTAITPANFAALSLTPAQASSLRFDPVSTFTGNAFFDYVAIDNAGAQSLPALYTIKVGQDNNSAYTSVTRGGNANLYQNGDVVAFGIDPNGAAYNAAGVIYDPAANRTGTPAAGTNSGLQSAAITAANTAALTAVGIAFDPATGLFTVVDATKLPRAGTTIPVSITTIDLLGGTNTQSFSLVLGNNPLPVELAAFTAVAVKNVDAQLNWRTASEKNNDHFDVERSLTGTNFVKIGQVKGQGNSSSLTDYALTDAGIGAKTTGLVYYRLKQVDVDGTTNFSPVRTVAFTNTAVVPAITVYPNPATTSTALDLTQLPAGNYQVSIVDATGRVVLGTSLSAGSVRTLNLNTIASGTYMVLVRGQNNGQLVNLTKRLIKE